MSRGFLNVQATVKRKNSCQMEAGVQNLVEGCEADRYSDNKDSLSKPSHFSFGLDFAQPFELFTSMVEEQTVLAAAGKQVRSPVRRSQSEILSDEQQFSFTRLHLEQLPSDQTVATRHSRNLSLGDRTSEQWKPSLEAAECKLEDLAPVCSSHSLTKAENLFNLEELESVFERESCGSETPKWALAPSLRVREEAQKLVGFSAALKDHSLQQSARSQPQRTAETALVQETDSQTDSRQGQLTLIAEELSAEEALASPVARPRNKPLHPHSLFDRLDSPRSPGRLPGPKLDPALLAAEEASNHSRMTAATAERKTGSTVGTPSTKLSLQLDNKRSSESPSQPDRLPDARVILLLLLFALLLLAFELA